MRSLVFSGMIFALIGFSSFSAIAASDEHPQSIGVVLPLTGDLASIGLEIQRGIKLALRDSPIPALRVEYEDDHSFNKAMALTAATKLVRINRVDILLNSAINTSNVLDPLLRKSRIPSIILWDNNVSLKGFAPNVFSVGYSTETAGKDMAAFAKSTLKVQTVVVVSAEDEWSEVISQAFLKHSKENGLKLLLHERVLPAESDFKALLTRISALKPDAIYLPVNPPAVGILIQRLRELHFAGAILTADGFAENEISGLKGLAEGIYATQILVHSQELCAKYAHEFGSNVSPVNLGFVALGYDGFIIAQKLLRESQSRGLTPGELAPEFRHSGYTGVSVLTKSDLHQKHESIAVVRGGRFEVVGK